MIQWFVSSSSSMTKQSSDINPYLKRTFQREDTNSQFSYLSNVSMKKKNYDSVMIQQLMYSVTMVLLHTPCGSSILDVPNEWLWKLRGSGMNDHFFSRNNSVCITLTQTNIPSTAKLKTPNWIDYTDEINTDTNKTNLPLFSAPGSGSYFEAVNIAQFNRPHHPSKAVTQCIARVKKTR